MAKAKKKKQKMFRVAVTKTLYSTVGVEASSPEEAMEKAAQQIEDDDTCFDLHLENFEYAAVDAFENR